MDRPITNSKKRQSFTFDYLDLFPYVIAVLMLCGEVYILNGFVALTHMMHH